MIAALFVVFTYSIPAYFETMEEAGIAERETCSGARVSWIESSEYAGQYGAPYVVRCEFWTGGE